MERRYIVGDFVIERLDNKLYCHETNGRYVDTYEDLYEAFFKTNYAMQQRKLTNGEFWKEISHPDLDAVLKTRTMVDVVNHPSHYTSGTVECIDAIESAITGLNSDEAFNTGQVIKYLWRWKRKNGLEDLQKAEFYLHRLMDKQKEGERNGSNG